MKVVALTGGIASGKSEVLEMFMRLGAFVIDCDVLSREALKPCSDAWWEVVRTFGTSIIRRDLEIDRMKLREIVFSDEAKRKTLERIVHPVVMRKLKERLEAIKTLTSECVDAENASSVDAVDAVNASNFKQCANSDERKHQKDQKDQKDEANATREESKKRSDNVIVVVDVPLLFELGMQNDFDCVIVVYASEKKRLSRLMKRDGIGEELARNMLNSQMPLEEKVKLADYVIYNEGSIEETEEQVKRVFDDIINENMPFNPTLVRI